MNFDFHPFAAAADDRQYRCARGNHPHVVLQLGHVLFGSRLFGEIPRQHEFGFEHGAGGLERREYPSRRSASDGGPQLGQPRAE